jgi:hypothetical protein
MQNTNELTNDILGTEFKDFKGIDAINKLRSEKHGHIKGAFFRNDIGSIDLVWGTDGFGLRHIIERRVESGINIEEFLNKLPFVIENGEFIKVNKRGRFEIWNDGIVVIIEPKIINGNRVMLWTAFSQRKKPRP